MMLFGEKAQPELDTFPTVRATVNDSKPVGGSLKVLMLPRFQFSIHLITLALLSSKKVVEGYSGLTVH